MDSINQQQPEQNHQDLRTAEAIAKMQELAGKTNTCFFSTSLRRSDAPTTRPMAVLEVDDQGHFWFLSSIDSHKNQELQHDPSVQLLFQGSSHSDFMSVVGTATISTDHDRIKELWNPALKTWFTEGEDDPRITVVEVTPQEGYYWDTKHGNAVAYAKIALGAIIGKTLDDSIEGNLSV
ncbi:general stress protein 26 [Hymenobacter luteus]|uniref:General stress protein 26 n=2 Tax=Hymenobacter TaxID=89966 RepID=A0A7W9WD14_9BACT|nr:MULTISPECIES: pyridoxamine 5'-phosphate oxidase family protein [Hymenobacter]MBB4603735.1 general stress protein 26 [Hymenobacter latericoloratus]MBB6061509.1 general stress protein 26 [Hymenobacter luteus]